MKAFKWAALVAVVAAAVGVGSAFAPVAFGQTRVAKAPRAFATLIGRGSQIGVSIRDVEEADVKTAKLSAQAGVVVEEVNTESPAEKAGIKKGDVVLEYDGERIRGVRQLTRLVQETPSGRNVQASLSRDGQRVNVTIEPTDGAAEWMNDFDGARIVREFSRSFPTPAVPPVPPARPAPPAPPAPPLAQVFPDMEGFVWRSGNSLGVTVSDLSSQLAEYFATKDGVLVTSVASDSAAAKAGIKAGDVITGVNGSSVGSPSELRQRVQRLDDGDEFTVTVMRDKKSLTLKGKFESGRSRRTYRSIV